METFPFAISNLYIIRVNMKLLNTFFVLNKARIKTSNYTSSLKSQSTSSYSTSFSAKSFEQQNDEVAKSHAKDASSCKGFCLQQGRIVYSFKISPTKLNETNCWAYTFEELSCVQGTAKDALNDDAEESQPCRSIVLDENYITEFIPWNLSKP